MVYAVKLLFTHLIVCFGFSASIPIGLLWMCSWKQRKEDHTAIIFSLYLSIAECQNAHDWHNHFSKEVGQQSGNNPWTYFWWFSTPYLARFPFCWRVYSLWVSSSVLSPKSGIIWFGLRFFGSILCNTKAAVIASLTARRCTAVLVKLSIWLLEYSRLFVYILKGAYWRLVHHGTSSSSIGSR